LVDTLALRCNLLGDALAWLARRLDRSAVELGPLLARKTPVERDAFLTVNLPDETAVAAACRWLLAQPAEAVVAPGLAGRIARATGSGSPESAAAALHALLPENAAPILLLVPPVARGDNTDWMSTAVANLAPLAEAIPRLPLFAAIERETLERYH